MFEGNWSPGQRAATAAALAAQPDDAPCICDEVARPEDAYEEQALGVACDGGYTAEAFASREFQDASDAYREVRFERLIREAAYEARPQRPPAPRRPVAARTRRARRRRTRRAAPPRA